MGYLQLAEDPYSHLAQPGTPAKDLFVFVPAGFRGAQKDMWVREDMFDNMPESEYKEIMNALEPYQSTGMSYGFTQLSGKAEREERKRLRMEKKASRGAGARREARAERQAQRQAARLQRQEARAASGNDLASILGKAGGIVSNIMGGGDTRGVDVGGSVGGVEFGIDSEQSFFEQYRTPLIIGGLALAGFAAYKMFSK
jgi:hypothetical protein